MRKSKVARRDGSMEAFDFYDTYNPRHNKVNEARHITWPVIITKSDTGQVAKAFAVKRPMMDSRSMFLTQLSPEE